jgi:hypothetical protein
VRSKKIGFLFGIVLKIDLPISIRISTPQSADTGVDILQFFCQISIKISFIVANSTGLLKTLNETSHKKSL